MNIWLLVTFCYIKYWCTRCSEVPHWELTALIYPSVFWPLISSTANTKGESRLLTNPMSSRPVRANRTSQPIFFPKFFYFLLFFFFIFFLFLPIFSQFSLISHSANIRLLPSKLQYSLSNIKLCKHHERTVTLLNLFLDFFLLKVEIVLLIWQIVAALNNISYNGFIVKGS